MEELVNNAIRLCEFELRDQSVMLDILTDKSVGKTYMLPEYTCMEEVVALFYRFLELSKNPLRYVRAIRVGEQLVGFINDTEIRDGKVELGWVIAPKFQNKGIGTAAVEMAIAELWSLGYYEVIAGAFDDNLPSLRVMIKNGMRLIEHEDEITYRNKIHRCIYYSIT